MDEHTCIVDACERAPLARNYCPMHYQRWRKYGDPLVVKLNRGNTKPRPVVTERTCLDCSVTGPESDFRTGRNLCRPCNTARQRAWSDANPHKVAASKLRNAEKAKAREEIRKATRKGIDPALIEAYRADHGGLCEICQGEPSSSRGLYIDHDHATGKFRGLLCSACNSALGLMKDDTERLASAIGYLSRHAAVAPSDLYDLIKEQ